MTDKVKVHKVKKSKRGRPKLTIEQKLYRFLERQEAFIELPVIYKALRARSIGQKAGIRGLLNRGCGEEGRFIRNGSGSGEYRAA